MSYSNRDCSYRSLFDRGLGAGGSAPLERNHVTIDTWTTDEVFAELQDVIESGEFAERERSLLLVATETQIARTVKFYGNDRNHWPVASWHHVREMETRLAKLNERLDQLAALRAEYSGEIVRREALDDRLAWDADIVRRVDKL